MVDDRPYAHARTHAAACRELKRESGRQFDPEVVEAFLAEVTEEPEHHETPMPFEVPSSELTDMTAHLRELLKVRQSAMSHAEEETEVES
jgi:HD-GYP domain-containing protein (c-di-GMP phosphodiesterase class II)